MATTSARLNAADAAIETLRASGVDTVFGIISIHMLDLYDTIARGGAIRLVVPRHEQGAVHMADGYARASGRVGVAFTSTGPGAANSMGAMFEAYTSRSRVLQVTSQVPSTVLGLHKGGLHEAKAQERMFESVADFVRLSESAEDIPRALNEAFAYLAKPGAGPAVVSIPVDLQGRPLEGEPPPVERHDSSVAPAPPEQYDRAAEMLSKAQHPMILLGGGMMNAARDAGLRARAIALAEALSAPIVLSPEGRGVVPEDHPLVLGSVLPDPMLDPLLGRCDALLAIGTRFRGQATRDWALRLPEQLIHVDVDPAALGRNYPAAIGIVDDAANAIRELGARVRPAGEPKASVVAAVAETTTAIRDAVATQQAPLFGLAETIRAVLPRDGILVADATIITYQVFSRVTPIYEPAGLLFPSSYAIGPSLPLALGAKLGAPQRKVVQVGGDGGYMLNMSELATAAQYNIPIVSVIVNDGGYGILRMLQQLRFEGRQIGVDLRQPDFVRVAEGFGIESTRVASHAAFREALTAAIAADGPRLIEVDLKGLSA